MKKIKILTLVSILIFALLLTGCGNQGMGFGNFTYRKVHVNTYEYSGCFTIEIWYESATGIEVDTREVGSIYLSEGTYILFEDECPMCNGHGG